MKEFTCVINDALGIHARPAGMLAKKAKEFASEIAVTKVATDQTVKASQLMKLMGLGVKCGDQVTIAATGSDEDTAIEEMKAFFKENFAASF